MGSNGTYLFDSLPPHAAPDYLCERVLDAVGRERAFVRKARLAVASLSTVASAAGFSFALPALLSAAERSGFTAYVSLALSDGQAVLGHFHTFTYSLLESLPGLEAGILILLSVLFLGSLRALVRAYPLARASFTVAV